jgi:predicted transcriptional regulator
VKSTFDTVFKALADPTRRAIFECLSRNGEQTIRPLTKSAGVSRQAVLKHPQVLKLAGLLQVSEGHAPRYAARCEGTAPVTDWLNDYGAGATAPRVPAH